MNDLVVRGLEGELVDHVVAVFWRYGARLSEEFPTVKEAAAFLRDGEERNEISAERITTPDGTTIAVDPFDVDGSLDGWAWLDRLIEEQP